MSEFSQHDVCHADLFISLLTVSVDYHRNELNRLHRGVYETTHTVHTLLGKRAGMADKTTIMKALTVRNTEHNTSIQLSEIASTVAADSWLGIKRLVLLERLTSSRLWLALCLRALVSSSTVIGSESLRVPGSL